MKTFLFLIAVTFSMLAPMTARAEGMTITDAYSFAVPEGAKTAAAFMTITYPPATDGASPDRLLKAEAAISELTEIHTTVINDNVMQMRKMENLPLSPLGTMNFAPRGMHIMFINLNQPLVIGSSFPLTLTFEKAGQVLVDVKVRAPGDIPVAGE